jgi:hypothetical protein
MKSQEAYIIRKTSRNTTTPYSGASCALAGVTEGLIYTNIDQAKTDVNKLNAVNPVGFEIFVLFYE